MAERLFPADLPERQWARFAAAGFADPVPGALYTANRPPCCGMPLGGLSTGCLDIDARGVYGFSSLFNPVSQHTVNADWRMPRKLPSSQPFLGLAAGGMTWVLAAEEMIGGDRVEWCFDPPNHQALRDLGYNVRDEDPAIRSVVCTRPQGVEAARGIEYWGHFPVVDMEYDTTAPVSVGLRAWAPFIPGDAALSNTPGAAFEVHLRNPSNEPRRGTIAFSFPGPDAQEARATEFTRTTVVEDFRGTLVSSAAGVNYLLGVIGDEPVRFGAGLCADPGAWSRIADELPQPVWLEQEGQVRSGDASCSAAVDFDLGAGEEKVVRFLLCWYAPVWEGGQNDIDRMAKEIHRESTHWVGSEWAGDQHYYTHMYAARYGSSVEVARRLAAEYDALQARVLGWQAEIYGEESLPDWLQDSLVNNLALIPEDSHWAQARPPLGDWAFPGGAFALNESPRGCPQMACMPCEWYGNLPIVFFFPELALSTLRAIRQYQNDAGEVPLAIGKIGELPDLATPRFFWQVSLNGTCYVDMVDRLWLRTGDDGVVREFYESVRKCTTFTMNLCQGPGGVISMPDVGGMEWFELGDWAGMATHMGGLRLAHLRMVERMAEVMGDADYADQCRQWFADGSRAMEEEMWAGSYYLNFYEKQTGKKSDDVMGYQLDGQWAAEYHGLPGVFRADRVKTTLDTIRRFNVSLTPDVGAANFARPDGSPLSLDSDVAYYGQYAFFAPELVVLAMTYAYADDREFGQELARRGWANIVLRQGHAWDLPNNLRGDTGERIYGTDYYQAMMLWALPAALAGQDLKASCAPGELVDRIIEAGK